MTGITACRSSDPFDKLRVALSKRSAPKGDYKPSANDVQYTLAYRYAKKVVD